MDGDRLFRFGHHESLKRLSVVYVNNAPAVSDEKIILLCDTWIKPEVVVGSAFVIEPIQGYLTWR